MARKGDWDGCLFGLGSVALVVFFWLIGIAISLGFLGLAVYVVILVLRASGVIN